jgi:hypothetical protein
MVKSAGWQSRENAGEKPAIANIYHSKRLYAIKFARTGQ